MAGMSEHWYAARSKPSQERLALKYLHAQNFITYWPQIEIEKIKAGKVAKFKEPLFPGYIFINFTLEPGLTPLVRAERLADRLGLGEVWVKNDAANPTHSPRARRPR